MNAALAIVRDGRIYAIANVVNRVAGLALLPLFTHVLSPGEFGLYTLVQSVMDVLSVLCGLGLTSAMNRFYLEYPDDAAMRDRVIATVLLLVGGLALLIALLAWPAGRWLSQAVLGSSAHTGLCAVALVALGCIALFEVQCAYAVVRKQVRTYFVLCCAKALALVACNLWLVGAWSLGVIGVVLATALSMGGIALVALVLILRRTGLHFSVPLALRLVRFGLPLVPSALGNSALGVVERYYLHHAAGAAAVGLYSLGNRLASLLQMFLAAPFSQTYAVRRVETLVKGEDQQVYDRVLLLFVLVMCLSAFALSVFGADLVALLATSDYAGAVQLVPVLGLCYVLASINFNLELGIHYTQRTWAFPLVTGITLLASIPLNAWLAARHGAMGTALALLAVNGVRLVGTLVMNARVGSRLVRLDWTRALPLMALSLALACLVVQWPVPALSPSWLVAKALLVAALAALLVASPLVGASARAELLGLWRRPAVNAAA